MSRFSIRSCEQTNWKRSETDSIRSSRGGSDNAIGTHLQLFINLLVELMLNDFALDFLDIYSKLLYGVVNCLYTTQNEL